MTTPPPRTGAAAQSTSYTYDWAGRIIRTVLADGAGVTNVYHATGELATNYGARVYPSAYLHDYAGRLTNLTTWQNFGAGSGAATTSWRYDGQRGFLTNKVYADGLGTKYSYSSAGRLLTRSWARGTNATYSYTTAADLSIINYSDSTADVTNAYDRLGRPSSQAAGSHLEI